MDKLHKQLLSLLALLGLGTGVALVIDSKGCTVNFVNQSTEQDAGLQDAQTGVVQVPTPEVSPGL